MWSSRLLLAGLLVAALQATAAQAQIQTVLLKGATAPEPLSTYRSFRQPQASDAPLARVALVGKLRTATGGANGLFTEDPVAPGATIVLRDDMALSGHLYRRFSRPAVNILGDAVFHAELSGGEPGIYGIGPTNVARTGDLAPFPLNGSLSKLSRPELTAAGEVVFHTTVTGGSLIMGVIVDEMILRCSGGDRDCSTGTGILEIVAAVADPVSDRPGRFLCSISDRFGASTYGIVFHGVTKLDCTDTLEIPLEGMFRVAFGGLIETVALQGEQSHPFLGVGGTVYGSFSEAPVIENDGIVAFLGTTSGVAATQIIFRCDPALCPAIPAQAWVQTGDSDPFLFTVSKFSGVGISDAADVVFEATVNELGSKARAIYVKREVSAILERIVARDDPVPGVVPASIFGELREPSVSPGGRIAWRARIKRVIGGGTDGIFLFE